MILLLQKKSAEQERVFSFTFNYPYHPGGRVKS